MAISESSSRTAAISMEWSTYFPPGYCGSGSKKEDVRKVRPPKKVAREKDDAMEKTADQSASKETGNNKLGLA